MHLNNEPYNLNLSQSDEIGESLHVSQWSKLLMSGLTLYWMFTFTRARKLRRPRTFEEAIIIINFNGFF